MIALDPADLITFQPRGRLASALEVALPLATPVEVDGKRVEALRFRAADKRDLRRLRADPDPTGRWLDAIARLSGVSAAAVAALAEPDAARAVQVVIGQIARLSGRSPR